MLSLSLNNIAGTHTNSSKSLQETIFIHDQVYNKTNILNRRIAIKPEK